MPGAITEALFLCSYHLLACKISDAKLISITASELTIGFNNGMSFLAETLKKNTPYIERTLKKVCGRTLKLRMVFSEKKVKAKDNGKVKEQVFSEPLVQDAVRIFNSSMISVKSLEEQEQAEDSD